MAVRLGFLVLCVLDAITIFVLNDEISNTCFMTHDPNKPHGCLSYLGEEGWGGGGLLGHSNKSFSFSTPRVICGEDDDDASGAIARPPAWKLGHPSAP